MTRDDEIRAAYERGVKDAADVLRFGFDRGLRSARDKCAHGFFDWDTCEECAIEAIHKLIGKAAFGP